jgi:hypothetical protein
LFKPVNHRQVNVDYSVCNALNFNTDGLRESLVIYDIMCQYSVHFEDRIRTVSDYLSLDSEMKILGAVGKFHLADHVDSCFAKWTLNFMQGAGHIDGEILETLWSGMNKVSGAARSMSKAHRQETLDDYMRDANWKKTVGIGEFFSTCNGSCFTYYSLLVPTLLTKHKRSQDGLTSTQPAFDELTKLCLQRNLPIEAWKSAEHLAMKKRGKHLNIFDLRHEKAPTLAQVTLQLTETKDRSANGMNIVDWIADGIRAQNDQCVLNAIYCPVLLKLRAPRAKLKVEIAKLPEEPTVKQRLKVAHMRARLGKQVKDFLEAGTLFLPALEEDDLVAFPDEEVVNTPPEEAVEPVDLDVDDTLDEDHEFEGQDEAEVPSVLPEEVMLPLPSNIISTEVRAPIESLRLVERELRKGQANDSLEGLRVALANKSLLLLTDVNQSTTTKQSTRAWAGVRNAESQVLSQARSYQRAWQALKRVGTQEDLLVYQKLDVKDLVTVKDITMAKRFGQGSDSLAWFWRIGPSQNALTGEWLEECKLDLLCFWMIIG